MSQSHSGCFGEQKNLLRTEPGCHGRPSRSIFTGLLRQTQDPTTKKKVCVRVCLYVVVVCVCVCVVCVCGWRVCVCVCGVCGCVVCECVVCVCLRVV